MAIVLAGAPVSFGVFELTDPADLGRLPSPDRILQVLSDAGYAGVDLGPPGFLGRGARLRERLGATGLGLAGGWIDLPFSDDDAFRDALPRLDDALELFEAVRGLGPLAPRPTLADSGDATRRAHPGGGPGLELPPDRWRRLLANVHEAAGRVRERGLEPTFHHHACTFVETPAEVDRLLDGTDIGLTFDTGHVLLGGGEPLPAFLRWAERIDHLHIKDVDLGALHAVQAQSGGMLDVWRGGVFVALGEGDLDLPAIVAAIGGAGYGGWLVLEQDVMPAAGDDPARVEADQVLNIERLRALL